MEERVPAIAQEYRIAPRVVRSLLALCGGDEPLARRLLDAHYRAGVTPSEKVLRLVLDHGDRPSRT